MKTLFLVLSAFLVLQGCTVPTMKKADVRTAHVGQSVVKNQNYVTLARYWDDHATKMTIDFKGASYMSIIPEEGRAEITIGNGPYYGLIDLRKITDHSTRVTSYGWGGMSSAIQEWVELIRSAP